MTWQPVIAFRNNKRTEKTNVCFFFLTEKSEKEAFSAAKEILYLSNGVVGVAMQLR
jgi:hypothetical protein